MDAAVSAALTELNNLSSFKKKSKEGHRRLYSTPDWLWQEFNQTTWHIVAWHGAVMHIRC